MNAQTKTLPPPLVLQLPNGVEMAFRRIPSGSFLMGSRGYSWDGSWHGSEEPIHRVEIPEPFWLAETPVTQAQFAVWARAEGMEHKNQFEGHPDHPAETLDWRQAVRFCAWLTRTKREQLPDDGNLAYLPTDAEWEYACRAGTDPENGGVNTEYHTGDGEAALTEAGWFEENSNSATHPVGLKTPNAFGLHDMHGNVWEWCHDIWDPTAYRKHLAGIEDPGRQARFDEWRTGLDAMLQDTRYRVLRGGSWFDSARFCRSAFRIRNWPDDSDWVGGFRVCLVRGPADETEEKRAAEPRRTTKAEGRGLRRFWKSVVDLGTRKLA